MLVLAATLWAGTANPLGVPFVRQDINGCGSAAASMVMKYWMLQGAPVDAHAADADTIQRQLYSSSSKGIHGTALRGYLEANGFRAFVIDAQEEDLRHHLSLGRPMIVCLGPKSSLLHYVVVVGVDEESDKFVVNDPARGKALSFSGAEFRKLWKATGNWTLLAVPAT